MNDKPASFTNQFLIAMPKLSDPNFFHSVTYICEHNQDGALGIVINRPLNLTLREVLEHMEIPIGKPDVGDLPVYFGGPVQQERGFILHRPHGAWGSTMPITQDIALTTSRDILTAIAEGSGPQDLLIALGYAGWGPGQLEQEMTENAWLHGPADDEILFEMPYEKRWEAAAAQLGVDLRLISSDVGHA